MAGRHVQQWRGGSPDGQCGRRQSTALSAGERSERPVVPEGAEAETVEYERGALVRVSGLPFLGLFEPDAVVLLQVNCCRPAPF